MRHSKAMDYWKAVRKGTSTRALEKVEFKDIPGIGSGNIKFNSSINAMCGKNGLGKSTILRGIACCLENSFKEKFKNTDSRIGENDFSVHVAHAKDKCEIFQYSDNSSFDGIIFLDPTELCQAHLATLRSESALSDALEQVDFGVLGSKEQVEIKRILGREYASIEYAELDDVVEGATVPYFKVSRNGITYESLDMALGELAILTMFWVITREEGQKIVFLEEPENFLTPQAQRYVCDYLAFTAVKRNDWYLISTHSEHIVESVGLSSTHVLVEGDSESPVHVKSPRHSFEYLQHLGISPKKKGIILVEDTAAKMAIDTACQHFGSFIKQDYEVIKIGGTGEICSLLKNFPKKSEFSVIGIFDGNERGKISLNDEIAYDFLPSDQCPEEALRSLVIKNPREFGSYLGTHSERLTAALSAANGEDPHDWLESLASNLDMGYPECLKGLCRGWVASQEEEFAKILREIDSSEFHYSVLDNAVEEEVVESLDGHLLEGHVKFFNPAKQFGFIDANGAGTLFFHANFLINELDKNRIRKGTRVTFTAHVVEGKPKNEARAIGLK